MAIEIHTDNSHHPHDIPVESPRYINSLYELENGAFITLCHVNSNSKVERSTILVASQVQYESERGSYVVGQQFLPSNGNKGKCVYERRIYWDEYWQPNKGSWLERPTLLDIVKFKLNL